MKSGEPILGIKAAVEPVSYAPGRRFLKLRIPLIAVAWAASYGAAFASPPSGTAWLSVAEWGAAHGLGNLARSSQSVTICVTILAALGPVLRIGSSRERWPARNLGFWAVGAPWGILLPAASAGFYELALAVASLVGLSARALKVDSEVGPSRWRCVVRESFPLLSAACFLTMSWQYNALRLMQGLLIAAGVSLLLQAALPAQAEIRSRLPQDPAAAS